MKRMKLIILGIAISLLLVGFVYAAWSSQAELKVNAGTGGLNVEITDKAVCSVSTGIEFDSTHIAISQDKKNASVAIGNLYPGGSVEFKIYATNTGTLPVKLDKLAHDTIEVIDKETNKSLGRNAEVFSNFQAAYSVIIMGKDGNTIDSISGYNTENQSNWEEDIYANNDLPNIHPGESAVIIMRVYLEESATEIAENKLFRFSITPVFVQGN